MLYSFYFGMGHYPVALRKMPSCSWLRHTRPIFVLAVRPIEKIGLMLMFGLVEVRSSFVALIRGTLVVQDCQFESILLMVKYLSKHLNKKKQQCIYIHSTFPNAIHVHMFNYREKVYTPMLPNGNVYAMFA